MSGDTLADFTPDYEHVQPHILTADAEAAVGALYINTQGVHNPRNPLSKNVTLRGPSSSKTAKPQNLVLF